MSRAFDRMGIKYSRFFDGFFKFQGPVKFQWKYINSLRFAIEIMGYAARGTFSAEARFMLRVGYCLA